MKKFSKKILALLLSVTMIFSTMMPSMVTVEANDVGNAIGAGVVTSAIKAIPGVGGIAGAAFGPLIGKAFGVPSVSKLSKQIEEVSKKLDEVSAQIKNLDIKIDANHQEVMSELYKSELSAFFEYMNDVQNGTKTIFSSTSSIIDETQSMGLDEDTALKMQMLQIACMVKSTTFNYSNFLSQVSKAKSAIDGTSFQSKNQSHDNALSMVYKSYCNSAVLGGEAAMMASDTVNAISTSMQNAYVAANIVLYACLYVNQNYDAYESLVANDASFKKYSRYLDTFVLKKDFENPASQIQDDAIDLWGEDIFDKTDVVEEGNIKINEDTKINIGDTITDGFIGKYNDMVEEAWFWYINKVDYSKSPAVVSYEKLDKEINFIVASDYGTPCGWNDTSSKTQTGSIESHARYSAALRTAPSRGVTRDQLKSLLDHIKNSEYFGTKGTNKVTLEQALRNYGFSFANFDSYVAKKPLPQNTVEAFLTKVDCKVEKHYDSITAYGPRLSDDVNTAYNNFDLKHYADINYTNGKADYLRIQLGGDTTQDLVTFYFTAAQTIDNEVEFIDFYQSIANGTNYRNKTIRLTKDLDLSKYNLLTIWNDANKEKRFCGVFDGNGHTIKNVDMSSGTEWVGLFRSMGIDGEVKNLTITDSKFGNGNGIAVGGVVGQATGDNSVIDNVTVTNCVIKGTDYVGGIVGTSSLKEADYCDDMCSMIRIRNCVSDSTIIGNGRTGGIEGGGGSVRIEKCTNLSSVTANGVAGGIYGEGLNRDEDPQVVVKDCTNKGEVVSKGLYAGGIVALINSDARSIYIYNNKNYADIKAKNIAGGIVAVSYGGGNYNDNKNFGNVTADTSHAAGIVAWIQDDGGSVSNNENSGAISGYYSSGGIAGYAGDNDLDRTYIVENNKNSGNVSVTNGYAGGVIAHIDTDNTKHSVKNNTNTGNINANSLTGGIVGYNEGGGVTSYNINKGVITSSADNAGGIVGKIEDDKTEIAYNKNYNSVTGANQTGGMVGYIGSKSEDDAFNIHDNMNCGDVTSTGNRAGGMIGHLDTDANHTVNNNTVQYANIQGAWSTGGIIGRHDGGGTFDGNVISNVSVVSTYEDAGGIVGYITDDKCDFVRSSVEQSSLIRWLGSTGFKAVSKVDPDVDTTKKIEVKIQGKKHTGKIVGYDDYRNKTLDGDTLTGSVFGSGNLLIIVAMLAIIVIAGAVIVIVNKKKKNYIISE